jgi:hypothetical protein
VSKGFGLASLMVSIIGIIVPVVTIYVVWLALALASTAAFFGNKKYTISSFFTCLINVLFLSPLTLALLYGESTGGKGIFLITTIILFIAPLGILIIKNLSK